MKKVLATILAICLCVGLCACSAGSSSSSSGEKTPEEQVRLTVLGKGKAAYFGSTIGGNELKSSDATITNIKRVSDTQYLVSGKIVMTDIYGTNWSNTFDCTVTKSGDSWRAGSFEYKSTNWTKG